MSRFSSLGTAQGFSVALFVAWTVTTQPARAADPSSTTTASTKGNARDGLEYNQDKLSTARKGLSVAGAIVPGSILHGTGHIIAGHGRTGLVLLGAEGVGFGLIVGGLGGLAATGATRRFVGPLVFGTVIGGALFSLSALADLYGVLAPKGGTGGAPVTLPMIETQLGLAYVYDPNFAYSLFATPGIDARLRSVRVSASGFFALDDANTRTRVELAYRFFGPRPRGSARARDGSFIDAEFALTNHHFASYGFSVTTGELNVEGRLDLGRVGPTLQGSFVECGIGIGYAAHRYEGIGSEGNELLTPRFAFGMYLGHKGYPRGEIAAYYEHRHDGFAAGSKMRGLGSGVAGHFGVGSRIFMSPRWGFVIDAQAGSAYVGRGALLFRYGGNP